MALRKQAEAPEEQAESTVVEVRGRPVRRSPRRRAVASAAGGLLGAAGLAVMARAATRRLLAWGHAPEEQAPRVESTASAVPPTPRAVAGRGRPLPARWGDEELPSWLAVVVWLVVTAGLFGLDCALHLAFARTIEGVGGGTSSLAGYRDLRVYVVSLAILLVVVVLLAVYRLHRWSRGTGVRAAWLGRDAEVPGWLAPGVALVLLPVAVLLAVSGWWGLPFAGPGGQAVAGTQQALAGASGGAAVVALCAAGAVIVRGR